MGLENIHTDYFSCPEVSHFVLLSCTNNSVHQTTKSLCLWITLSSHLICLCWLPALAPPHLGIQWPPFLSLSLSPSLFVFRTSSFMFNLVLHLYFNTLNEFPSLPRKNISTSCQHIIHPLKLFVFLPAVTLYLVFHVLTSSFSTFFFPVFYFSFVNELCAQGICQQYLFFDYRNVFLILVKVPHTTVSLFFLHWANDIFNHIHLN